MSNLNCVMVEGRLVKNAVLSKTTQGYSMVKFDIANNRVIRNSQGGYDKKVSFIPVTAFGRSAEGLFPYLTKGLSITVVGKLVQDKWEKDGKKHSQLSIIVNELHPHFDSKKEEKVAKDNNEILPEKVSNIPLDNFDEVKDGEIYEESKEDESKDGEDSFYLG